MVHNKQPRTKFQISELCFPSQLYQQNNKFTTKPGITQSIPNSRSIYTYKEWAIEQKSNRWSIDSTLQQHIQQQFSKGWPRSVKLSKVRIWLWAAVHVKKSTLLGTLAFQMSFQRKVEGPSLQDLDGLLGHFFCTNTMPIWQVWIFQGTSRFQTKESTFL